uniref:Coenzyme Q-binding protein COQ10 START domain-containing protein n=1 Tax=Attheya septentrionalis TaxID=420275 RepID=A0A7S2XP63_9STRA|mmetsp:Transcript_25126/g.45482  ORF Transcript_25126/g.45482 Transcript_25126/m.45482 type:complete len:298 (+) Transcript_25126:175-1068(+)
MALLHVKPIGRLVGLLLVIGVHYGKLYRVVHARVSYSSIGSSTSCFVANCNRGRSISQLHPRQRQRQPRHVFLENHPKSLGLFAHDPTTLLSEIMTDSSGSTGEDGFVGVTDRDEFLTFVNSNVDSLQGDINADEESSLSESPVVNKREIIVEASLDLPFSSEIAYNAFVDTERQPSWSDWLTDVKILDESGSTSLWTMGFKGFKFQWTAKSTEQSFPHLIAWESTSGLRNHGRVQFSSLDGGTNMKLTITMVVPRVVAALFRRSNKMASFIERRMLMETLVNFRSIVIAEDLSSST